MKVNNTKKLVSAIVGLGVSSSLANAAINLVSVDNNNVENFAGSISNSDLINAGAASLGSATSSLNGNLGGSNDGIDPGFGGGTFFNTTTASPNLTLDFNLTGSATGYDITSINSIYGFRARSNDLANQFYTVFITTVTNSTFTELFNVNVSTSLATGPGASQVTLTNVGGGALDNGSGVVATGVTAIRFVATQSGFNATEVGIIRELDVFGAATVVPEPSSSVLLGLGGLALVLRRRK